MRRPLADTTAPLISFIIPAHNEEYELPGCLTALRGSADRVGLPYEVIVVSDASTDRTAAIAKTCGAQVIEVNLRHIAAVRNAGARVARGAYFFFVDADTRINSLTLSCALRALKDGAVGGGARVSYDDFPVWSRPLIFVFLLAYFAAELAPGAFLFVKREHFEAVGGFDERYFAGEEVFLSLALKARGRFRTIYHPVLTSGRKARTYSFLELWGSILKAAVAGPAASREMLSLWYEGKREGEPAQ